MFMATPGRFELPTCCFGGNRSIHLSYGVVELAKASTTDGATRRMMLQPIFLV
jgi:hypothetical protein